MSARSRSGLWRATRMILLAGVALVNGGCLLAVAGVATGAAVGAAYVNGKCCRLYNASLPDTRAAVLTALLELGLPITANESKGPGQEYVASRMTNGDKVRIYLDVEPSPFPAEGELTRVCVRVATFGDHPLSARILDQVGAHLVVSPGAGSPMLVDPVPPPPPAAANLAPSQTAPPPLAP